MQRVSQHVHPQHVLAYLHFHHGNVTYYFAYTKMLCRKNWISKTALWALQLAMQHSAVCMLGGVIEHGHSDTVLRRALAATLNAVGGGHYRVHMSAGERCAL